VSVQRIPCHIVTSTHSQPRTPHASVHITTISSTHFVATSHEAIFTRRIRIRCGLRERERERGRGRGRERERERERDDSDLMIVSRWDTTCAHAPITMPAHAHWHTRAPVGTVQLVALCGEKLRNVGRKCRVCRHGGPQLIHPTGFKRT
jgi:hypothetical protein